MDKISYKLVKILEQNARYTASDLAQMLDMSEGDVTKLIEKLENEGVICGYKAMIDWDKFSDSSVTALIEIKVTPKHNEGFEALAEHIMNMEEVESVYLMSGAYDFCVTVNGKSFKEVAFFVAKRLATIDDVVSTATHFVLRRYKELGVKMIKMSTDDRRKLSF